MRDRLDVVLVLQLLLVGQPGFQRDRPDRPVEPRRPAAIAAETGHSGTARGAVAHQAGTEVHRTLPLIEA